MKIGDVLKIKLLDADTVLERVGNMVLEKMITVLQVVEFYQPDSVGTMTGISSHNAYNTIS